MDGDTLIRETLMVLTGGLAFLEKVPDFLPKDILKSKNIVKVAFKDLLDKWNRVKSIEPRVIEEVPKSKIVKALRKLSTKNPNQIKKRSSSVSDVFDISGQFGSDYVYDSPFKLGITESLKPSQPQGKSATLDSHKTSPTKDITPHVPNVEDTFVARESDVYSWEYPDSMVSDGRFSMIESSVSFRIGNHKPFVKNLYCCLQGNFLLFGPKLTYTPPGTVINLEQCVIVQTVKNEIQLKEGDTIYSIRYCKEFQAKLWANKIREISPYTYVRDCGIDVCHPLSKSLDVLDDNYSYVRQERIISTKSSEYSYIRSLNCQDCHHSVERKISTAEAVIDSSYVNISSLQGTDVVKNLVSQYNKK